MNLQDSTAWMCVYLIAASLCLVVAEEREDLPGLCSGIVHCYLFGFTDTLHLSYLFSSSVSLRTHTCVWFLSHIRLGAFYTKHSRKPVYKTHYKGIQIQSEFPYNAPALFRLKSCKETKENRYESTVHQHQWTQFDTF